MSRKPNAPRSWIVCVAAGALSLTGCTTAAQQTFDADKAVIAQTQAQMTSCAEAANAKPAYAMLWAHTPQNVSTPDLRQLSDTSYMTPELKGPYLAWRTDSAACRVIYDQIRTVDLTAVNILRSAWADADSVRVKLLAGQITWGDSNTQIAALSRASQTALSDEYHSMVAGLQEQNDEELERRRAAAMAFGQAMQQQAALQQQQLQNQQLQNALNRPVNTNCYTYGSNTSCTSN